MNIIIRSLSAHFHDKKIAYVLKSSYLLGDTYEVYVSTIDFVKIVIRWYVTKSTYHLLISSRFLFLLFLLFLLFFLDFVRRISQDWIKPLSWNF